MIALAYWRNSSRTSAAENRRIEQLVHQHEPDPLTTYNQMPEIRKLREKAGQAGKDTGSFDVPKPSHTRK